MAEENWRERLRTWLAEHPPPPEAHTDVAAAQRYQAQLHDAGYAGLTWPKEWGGQGLGAVEAQAFAEESAAADLPTRPFMIGMGMTGPTLVDLGTPEQKRRYLPPLLRGEEIWCQLFSEPGAGSDVASLRTRAVREPDGSWVLSGQKVWTSNAQWADVAAVLARTDPDKPKHGGITMFVLDMRQPGVTVRPLVDMTGHAPFNEVYLDEARVPADGVLGEVDGGWRAATTMLGHERVSISGMRQRRGRGVTSAALTELAQRRDVAGDPLVRDRLADLYAHERVLELFTDRMRQETAAGVPVGARGSVGKLAGALLAHRGVEVAGHVAGADAVAWEVSDDGEGPGDDLALGIASAPAASIAGGTNEIQRSIIGERVLGLPREPAADRDRPFRDAPTGEVDRAAGSHV
ncbi:acyl-CoA dehydrogenase family protein [Actinomycetospora endophytica]|uniref:Acyl-CoA dehydrogenase family protein n=1 Tax=Actinomycetospora endophytica TaxID=2291215 RepID=A0ABS8PAM0_9PSEU|nr:acyl-CoA dehydrogenase family protein [Actinomycetospora endophytica]MCD2195317.1 acyl-CoA dehydrogenase family protein [Actinomycetospora endophytica]